MIFYVPFVRWVGSFVTSFENPRRFCCIWLRYVASIGSRSPVRDCRDSSLRSYAPSYWVPASVSGPAHGETQPLGARVHSHNSYTHFRRMSVRRTIKNQLRTRNIPNIVVEMSCLEYWVLRKFLVLDICSYLNATTLTHTHN